MRALINWFKIIANGLDGVWINNGGWPIEVIGYFKPTAKPSDSLYIEDRAEMIKLEKPIKIYGFYTLPEIKHLSYFGIDSPDEMIIEVNPNNICRMLGKLLSPGLVLETEGMKWLVVNIRWRHHWFFGKRRMSLHCQMYQESITTGPVNGKVKKSRV